ncbi:MAG: CRISPR-associated endonuclease Cas2 [Desulfobacteraceae bacterium]|nr:MAG: CRISPR-associated endonuclease Cas2 [Desulfobacteraceae bacterium]
MSKKKFYIVSYDIVDDRKRNKAADTLKDFGTRVQKSVFECSLKDKTLKKLMEKLKKIIDAETDSILLYYLCEACGKEKMSMGVSVFRDEKDFRII